MAGKKDDDNNSYFTFLAGILLVIVTYLLIHILKKIFHKIPYLDQVKYLNCNCSKCNERLEKYKIKDRKKYINKHLYINIILFIFFFYLFLACCYQTSNLKNQSFDPYEILEISPTATLSKIKHSYKQLSLKYHPDKNPNDKTAKEKFMQINKAYRALTNPKAIENYKKYGNPDGPGALSMSLALPLFLFEGKIGNSIITIFAILMTVVLPVCFIIWFKNSKKYTSSGLLSKNLSFYYKILDTKIKIDNIPYIVGMSEEFKDISCKIKFDEEVIVKKNSEKYYSKFPKNEEIDNKNIPIGNLLAIVLLYKHFFNENLIYENNNDKKLINLIFNNYKEIIIDKSLFIVDEIINIIIDLEKTYEYFKGIKELNKNEKINRFNILPYKIKEFNFDLIKAFIDFRTRLIHETNIDLLDNNLMQLPDVSNETQNSLKQQNIHNIIDLINCDNFQKFEKTFSNFSEINKAISTYPKYKINIDIISTHYEVGDLIILNLHILRNKTFDKKTNNQTETQNIKELGLLHSNNYINFFNEEIICFLVEKETHQILKNTKIKFEYESEEKNIEFNVLAEKNGLNKFDVYFFSLNYPGIILCKEKSIDISSKNDIRKNFVINRSKEVLRKEEFEDSYGILMEYDDEVTDKNYFYGNNEEGDDNEGVNEENENNENEHEHQN